MKKYDAIVVGAGAVGLSTAYYLHLSGCSVAVVDKDAPKSGCSFGNAGMIVPSHFNALAAPGVTWQGIKWAFSPTSPFSIALNMNPQTAQWLWLFQKKATQANVDRHQRLLLDLHLKSRDLYENMSKAIDSTVFNQGILMLYNSLKGEREEAEMAGQAQRLGLDIEVLDKAKLQDLEPDIDFRVKGGVHYKSDRHIHPNDFVQKLFTWVAQHCDFIQANVLGVELEKDKVSGINTTDGIIEGQTVFISAGIWSSPLLKKLNIALPMLGGKGYSFETEMPYRLKTPCLLNEAKVAITPLDKQVRFAGTMQIGANPNALSHQKIKGMVASIAEYMPQYKEWVDKKGEIWSGLRPLSPDGVPYIGRTHRYKNLFVGTGHAMMGISLAPVTGWVLSQLLLEKPVGFDMRLLAPERYAD